MTRAWFLSLLGLGAAGQRTVTTPIRPEDMASMYPGGSKRPKPRNGECPVCGTMAPAYRREKVSSGFLTNCKPNPKYREDDVTTWTISCEQVMDWDGPATRTISCAHCRVRFDQEAEDVK